MISRRLLARMRITNRILLDFRREERDARNFGQDQINDKASEVRVVIQDINEIM